MLVKSRKIETASPVSCSLKIKFALLRPGAPGLVEGGMLGLLSRLRPERKEAAVGKLQAYGEAAFDSLKR